MYSKKEIKRGLTIGLCAVITAGLIGGCGIQKVQTDNETAQYQVDENLNPVGEFPICKEPITLKIMKASDSLVEDFDTNKYTKKLEEYGNVNLEFELVPSADMQTKLNLIMNSGDADLPDIIITPMSQNQIASYSETGMLVPLNQYYEHSSKYLKEGIESLPEKNLMKKLTAADGNIYAIPRYNESLQNEFVYMMWIYKPWLDKLGMEAPKTLDEYKAVLQAFKDNDMNGNGDKNDEIPLVDSNSNWAIYSILNAFITFDPSRDFIVNNNGKLEFAFMSDKWKEGLKYLNELCTEGLFTPVSFTMDTQQFKTVLATEENKVGSFSWASTSCLPASSDRRGEFVAINPKRSEGENAYIYRETPVEQVFFITKGCKNPEAAFRLGDLMCSEEMTMWSRFGEKDVDWVEATESDKGLYEFLNYPATIKPILEWGSIQNSHWNNITPGFRTYEVAAGMVVANDQSQTAKAEAFKNLDLMNNIPKNSMDLIIYSNDELEEYNDLMLVIKSYVTEKLAHFIAGDESIDDGWDAYVSELKNMGADRALELSQTAYERMNDN